MSDKKITLPVVDFEGKEVENVELDSRIYGLDEVNEYAIQLAVKTYLANRRQATAKTKVRSEVSGSGKKLWRQKGTGRARMGNSRSPLWRHGGVVFGPTGKQNFKLSMNKRVYDLAIRSALTDKVNSNELIVLTDKPFDSHRTKDFATALKAINGGDKKTLLVLASVDSNLIYAARNMANVEIAPIDNLSVYDVVNHESVIFVKNALLVEGKEGE